MSVCKSRFVEMFGSDVDNTPWSVEKVEHIADVTVGVVIKPAQYYVEDASQGIRAFRSLNVQPMHVKDGDWVYFSIEGHEKNGKSSLKASDVLIVRSGYPGTSCVVGAEYEGSNAIDLIIAHPDLERINPTYLAAFNNCPIGQQQIQSGVGGAAQQHFNVGRYKSLKIPVPPLELQREFADFFAQVDKSEFVSSSDNARTRPGVDIFRLHSPGASNTWTMRPTAARMQRRICRYKRKNSNGEARRALKRAIRSPLKRTARAH